MRVNLSYSVELDDVPKEVDRILVECEGKLRAIHGELNQTIGKDPLVIIKELDSIRLKMADTDLQLDDCVQILNGYVQTLTRLTELKHGIASSPEITEEEDDE